MRLLPALISVIAAASASVLPDTAWALGGAASSPAPAVLGTHTVMVLGSRGSACSGTLIAPDVVVTAGHCVRGSKEMAVAWFQDGKPVLAGVSDTALHPQFVPSERRSIDLALVRLKTPLSGRFVPVRIEEEAGEETRFTLAGYGLQRPYDEKSAGTLRQADVAMLTLSTSRILHLGNEAEAARLQVCKGDSGGPVFTGAGATLQLAGVIVATYNIAPKPGATWSAICGNTAQAIRLAPQRDWIEGVLRRWR